MTIGGFGRALAGRRRRADQRRGTATTASASNATIPNLGLSHVSPFPSERGSRWGDHTPGRYAGSIGFGLAFGPCASGSASGRRSRRASRTSSPPTGRPARGRSGSSSSSSTAWTTCRGKLRESGLAVIGVPARGGIDPAVAADPGAGGARGARGLDLRVGRAGSRSWRRRASSSSPARATTVRRSCEGIRRIAEAGAAARRAGRARADPSVAGRGAVVVAHDRRRAGPDRRRRGRDPVRHLAAWTRSRTSIASTACTSPTGASRPRSDFDRAAPRRRGRASPFGALEEAGYDGWYDVEVMSDDGTFGEAFPDSLWALPAEEIARRAVESL